MITNVREQSFITTIRHFAAAHVRNELAIEFPCAEPNGRALVARAIKAMPAQVGIAFIARFIQEMRACTLPDDIFEPKYLGPETRRYERYALWIEQDALKLCVYMGTPMFIQSGVRPEPKWPALLQASMFHLLELRHAVIPGRKLEARDGVRSFYFPVSEK